MITPSPRRRCLWFLFGGISQQAGIFAAPVTIVFVLYTHAQRSYSENGLASLISLLLAWLLALPVGVLLDRVRRGPALTVAALLSAVTQASFAGAVWLDSLTAPHLLLAVVLLPVLWNAGELGRDAYLPAVVGRARLVPVNAAVTIVAGLASFWLPVAMEDSVLLLALSAAAFVVCALAFRAIDVPEEPAPPRAGWWPELAEGVRFTFAHPVLQAITLYVVVAALAQPLLDDLVDPRRDVPGSWLGYLAAPAGAAAAWLLWRRTHLFRLAWVSLLVTQPFAFLLALAGTGWGPLWYGLGTFLPWAGAATAAVTLLSHRQVITPSRLLGRTGATLLALAGLAGGASSLLQVLVISLIEPPDGPPSTGIVVQAWPAVVLCAAGLVAAVVPLYRARHLAEAPEPGLPAPAALPGPGHGS